MKNRQMEKEPGGEKNWTARARCRVSAPEKGTGAFFLRRHPEVSAKVQRGLTREWPRATRQEVRAQTAHAGFIDTLQKSRPKNAGLQPKEKMAGPVGDGQTPASLRVPLDKQRKGTLETARQASEKEKAPVMGGICRRRQSKKRDEDADILVEKSIALGSTTGYHAK